MTVATAKCPLCDSPPATDQAERECPSCSLRWEDRDGVIWQVAGGQNRVQPTDRQAGPAILREQTAIVSYYEAIADRSDRSGRPKPQFMNFGRTGSASPGLNLISHLTSELDLRGAAVIEFGCGRGGNLRFVERWRGARRCVGVDLSDAQIRSAMNSFPELTFIVGDAQTWNYSAKFDAALCVESLLHYSDLPGFASGVSASLRSGGVCVIWDFFEGDRLDELIETCGIVGLEPTLVLDESSDVIESWQSRRDLLPRSGMVDLQEVVASLTAGTGRFVHMRVNRR